MTITLNGTSGINTPGVVNTAAQTVATTLAVTGVSTLTGGFTVGATAAPAFSAYADATTQTLVTATYTKILFQTEEFDTASRYNNTASTVGGIPAYSFLPNVAGYYQINAQLLFPALAGSSCLVAIYKNGSDFKEGTRTAVAALASGGVFVSALVSMNGSTDYLEIYGQQSSGSSQNLTGTNNAFLNYFQAFLARSA